MGALRERSEALSILGILALVTAIPAYMAYDNWAAEEEKRAWIVPGPACPVVTDLTRPPFGARGAQTFDYGGIAFSRRYGHVACVAPAEGLLWDQQVYRVCQFSAPMTVGVSAGGQRWLFKPGVGRPATVTVRRGQVSCVVGGWFRG